MEHGKSLGRGGKAGHRKQAARFRRADHVATGMRHNDQAATGLRHALHRGWVKHGSGADQRIGAKCLGQSADAFQGFR